MFLIWQSIQIRISPKRGKCTWNSNLQTKCRAERRFHAFKFSDGYKSTMDWCRVYSTPQVLPKYIYFSPPLIFPTTYNGIRIKKTPGVNHFGHCSITLNGTESQPSLEHKRTEGYVIVSTNVTDVRWYSWNKMNCELMLTYDTPALWQTGSRNLTGQKTLPTKWGTYMKLVTK